MHENKRQPENDSALIELHDLLDDFATGELTDAQNARLQQLAIESEAAWRLYLQYMYMHGKIHQKFCNHDKRQQVFASLLDSAAKKQDTPLSSNESIFPLLDLENDLLSNADTTDQFGASIDPHPNGGGSNGFWGQINFSFVPGVIMAVASFLILSAVVILPIYWSMHNTDPKWSVAARITKTLDCQWAQGEKWSKEGTFLEAGQLLDLELGLVEIEFASGTRVVVQGPAQFVISGDNASRLNLGRLAATVPDGAEGFTVKTPDVDVIDLGTEFGVAVDTDGKTDVHVFKGDVEMKVIEKPNKPAPIKKKKTHLVKSEAAQYTKTERQITRIPLDEKSFVRTLDNTKGIVANLRVRNASFEIPDIRTIKEYEPKHGNTLFRSLYAWKMSDHSQEQSRVAMYQISPFKSSITNSDVGPGATEGRQVAVISLGVKSALQNQPRRNWIYQSLGIVTPADVGKTLKLNVDAGPRSEYAGLPAGNGIVSAGFALNVTPTQIGSVLDKPASFHQEGETQQLHQLEATVPLTVEMVGKELFILLMASDNGASRNIDEYHFDNVELSVEEHKMPAGR